MLRPNIKSKNAKMAYEISKRVYIISVSLYVPMLIFIALVLDSYDGSGTDLWVTFVTVFAVALPVLALCVIIGNFINHLLLVKTGVLDQSGTVVGFVLYGLSFFFHVFSYFAFFVDSSAVSGMISLVSSIMSIMTVLFNILWQMRPSSKK